MSNYKCRPSGAERFLSCASSIVPPHISIETSGAFADTGTACHELAAFMVEGKDARAMIQDVAEKYDVDETELSVLLSFAQKAWKKFGPYFSNPQTERRLSGSLTEGTADVFSHDGETCVILDWKTGSEKEATAQLDAYGHCAMEQYGMPKSGEVTIIVVWLRDQKYKVFHRTEKQLQRFAEKFRKQLERVEKDEFNPSLENCEYCKRAHECPAKGAMMRAAGNQIAEVSRETAITPELLGKFWQQRCIAKKAVENYDKALRLALSAGEIRTPDGVALSLTEQSREEVDVKTAWPVLQEHGFTREDWAECCSVSKGAIEKIAKAKAGKGDKEKSRLRIVDALREAGCVSTTRFMKITTSKGDSGE